jgi:hypothetical protein
MRRRDFTIGVRSQTQQGHGLSSLRSRIESRLSSPQVPRPASTTRPAGGPAECSRYRAFQASGEALLPRGRAAALGASGARKEHDRERRERFAGAKFHRCACRYWSAPQSPPEGKKCGPAFLRGFAAVRGEGRGPGAEIPSRCSPTPKIGNIGPHCSRTKALV